MLQKHQLHSSQRRCLLLETSAAGGSQSQTQLPVVPALAFCFPPQLPTAIYPDTAFFALVRLSC